MLLGLKKKWAAYSLIPPECDSRKHKVSTSWQGTGKNKKRTVLERAEAKGRLSVILPFAPLSCNTKNYSEGKGSEINNNSLKNHINFLKRSLMFSCVSIIFKTLRFDSCHVGWIISYYGTEEIIHI